MSMYNAIGVMSGTSMDAIDVALIETDGLSHIKFLDFLSLPYEKSLKNALLELLKQPFQSQFDDLKVIEREVTLAHTKAALSLKNNAHYYGFHGQTILHKPEIGFTRQLLDGGLAFSLINKPIVCNFRQNDMKHGGQGAPLVPIFHQALSHELPKPCIILNLGGVANITYIDENTLIACDTGAASALLDDFMRARTRLEYDKDGLFALKGIADEKILAKALSHPFFLKPPPKSLDRNAFMSILEDVSQLSTEDGAATLTRFTAKAIAKAFTFLPKKPLTIYVAGGGANNPTMMRFIAEDTGVPTFKQERGASMEAECFAYLAVRRMLNLPLSYPTTTGVKYPVTGGDIYGSL